MNPTVATLCSESATPDLMISRRPTATSSSFRSSDESRDRENLGVGWWIFLFRRSSPEPLVFPMKSFGSSAAVSGLTMISLASAVDSMTVVLDAVGPAMISSIWDSPTRKRSTGPLCMPWDMRSDIRPTEVGSLEASLSAARISTADAAACMAWSSVSKRSRRASPPNLSNVPPRAWAASSMVPKTCPNTWVSSSAPIRPRAANRSESAVKPEMSTNSSVPSTERQRVSVSPHSQATRDANRRNGLVIISDTRHRPEEAKAARVWPLFRIRENPDRIGWPSSRTFKAMSNALQRCSTNS